MQPGTAAFAQLAIGVVELVGIATEVVVLTLPAAVLDVDRALGTQCLVGGRVAGAPPGAVRIACVEVRAVVLDECGAAPVPEAFSVQERDQTAAVDRSGQMGAGEPADRWGASPRSPQRCGWSYRTAHPARSRSAAP